VNGRTGGYRRDGLVIPFARHRSGRQIGRLCRLRRFRILGRVTVASRLYLFPNQCDMYINISDMDLDRPQSILLFGCRRLKTVVHEGHFSVGPVAGSALFAGIRNRSIRGIPISVPFEQPVKAALGFLTLRNWAVESHNSSHVFAATSEPFSYSERGLVADLNPYGGGIAVRSHEMLIPIDSPQVDYNLWCAVQVGAIVSFELHGLLFFLA